MSWRKKSRTLQEVVTQLIWRSCVIMEARTITMSYSGTEWLPVCSDSKKLIVEYLGIKDIDLFSQSEDLPFAKACKKILNEQTLQPFYDIQCDRINAFKFCYLILDNHNKKENPYYPAVEMRNANIQHIMQSIGLRDKCEIIYNEYTHLKIRTKIMLLYTPAEIQSLFDKNYAQLTSIEQFVGILIRAIVLMDTKQAQLLFKTALEKNKYKLVNFLCAQDPELLTREGLYWIKYCNSAKQILSLQKNCDLIYKKEFTPFTEVLRTKVKDAKLIDALIKNTSNVILPSGMSILQQAYLKKRIDIIRRILGNPLNADKYALEHDSWGLLLIHHIVQGNDLDLFRSIILLYPKFLQKKTYEGVNLITYVLKNKRYELIPFLKTESKKNKINFEHDFLTYLASDAQITLDILSQDMFPADLLVTFTDYILQSNKNFSFKQKLTKINDNLNTLQIDLKNILNIIDNKNTHLFRWCRKTTLSAYQDAVVNRELKTYDWTLNSKLAIKKLNEILEDSSKWLVITKLIDDRLGVNYSSNRIFGLFSLARTEAIILGTPLERCSYRKLILL